jgi:phosphatidylserine/phosphatidylglycerophosphate/cardiolipin synthase-like enzyme
MKKRISIVIICSILFLLSINQTSQAATLTLPKDTPVEVFFSPKGGCTDTIIKEIDQAKADIFIQAYSFTSAPIAKALVAAHKRGVKVQAILDKSQRSAKYTSATFLTNAGIPTYIDDKHAIAHNKIMIIDRAKVITGSFNFTKAAEEKNAENLLIISSKELARLYLENWQNHKEHSEPYGR